MMNNVNVSWGLLCGKCPAVCGAGTRGLAGGPAGLGSVGVQGGFRQLQTEPSTGHSRAQHGHSWWHLCGNVFKIGHRQQEGTKRVRSSRGTPRWEEEEVLQCGAASPTPSLFVVIQISAQTSISIDNKLS